jgi:cell pole-organizing protein PopZ
MTQPIGERVASLETSVNAFHAVTGATLQKLAEGQEVIASEARAASKDAHLAVTAAEKAADMAGRAHAQDMIVGEHIKELQGTTQEIKGRLDELSLNGHGPDLKAFVTEDLPVVRELVQQAKDQAAAKRVREASWYWWAAKWTGRVLVPAALGAGLFVLFSHIL